MKNKKTSYGGFYRLLGVITLAIVSTTGWAVQSYKLHEERNNLTVVEAKRQEAIEMFSEVNGIYDKHDDGSYSLTTDIVRVRLWTNQEGNYELKVTEQGGSIREINNKKVVAQTDK